MSSVMSKLIAVKDEMPPSVTPVLVYWLCDCGICNNYAIAEWEDDVWYTVEEGNAIKPTHWCYLPVLEDND